MSFEKPWGNYLLDGIKETIAPQTISFWPQTLAWQIVLLLLILLAINKGYQLWQSYQDNAYRREALAWLAQCSLTNEENVRQLPALLRKTALLASEINRKNYSLENSEIAISTRAKLTQLSGKDWAVWLDTHCTKTSFSHQINTLCLDQLLAQLAYIPNIDLLDDKFNNALALLYQQIEIWIKYHDMREPNLPGYYGEQA